jgi:peptidoglycan hydrolase-like protein with peptidoglycan-binding domain
VSLTGTTAAPQPEPQPAIRADESLIFLIQHRLREAGYFPGRFDGRMSEGTATAIRAYQAEHGLPVNGVPSRALLDRLEGEVLRNRNAEDFGPTPLGAIDCLPGAACPPFLG